MGEVRWVSSLNLTNAAPLATAFVFHEHHAVPTRIPPVEAVRTERWKYIRWIKAEPVVEELYDLQNDPLEEKNLVADPARKQILGELRAKHLHWVKNLR